MYSQTRTKAWCVEIYIYMCVCVCIFFSTWCAAMFLWRSRIIAVSANVFCCLYPTINKVYLILFYLYLILSEWWVTLLFYSKADFIFVFCVSSNFITWRRHVVSFCCNFHLSFVDSVFHVKQYGNKLDLNWIELNKKILRFFISSAVLKIRERSTTLLHFLLQKCIHVLFTKVNVWCYVSS